MYAQLRKEVGEILRKLCGYKEVEVVEGSIGSDHIHMCLKIPPKIAVSEFMGYLKGKSALMIFDKHPECKKGPNRQGKRVLCEYGGHQQGNQDHHFKWWFDSGPL